MPYSLNELERRAYIDGNTAVAAALGRIVDAEAEAKASKEKSDTQEEQITELKRKIRSQDRDWFNACDIANAVSGD